MYDDVLIATDGSDVATNAATAGITMARALESTVHVISVVESRRGDKAKRRERRGAEAESVADRARDAGCEADSTVRVGRPASEILAYADDADVDAVVVGTHGRTGLRQALLGSVALEVIRDARRPVLTVGADASWDGEHIDDICLSTDGTSGSAAATDQALGLAEACDARLHSLYAVDATDDDLREAFERHGEGTTNGVAQRAADRGLETTGTVERGEPTDVVLEYVDDADVDLLVMGTESKSNLERLVVGSVSQRVVPNASVPVVTARTLE
ncbi:universal stress protein [Natronolimnohabitans innermongolicus]|uniref:UspA domain-containing protein n=1 Tax=Natronolimnohabitans innermongolicus JCM 12255 TaxID=1227499 RepID=L9XB82_9EURY|nr:universal stress protein [Natronolimnohabitans innermongolicus]ELY58691.1 UspA domain-containing protein [Natronolimnohabitans innermongolicus JCM 12255]